MAFFEGDLVHPATAVKIPDWLKLVLETLHPVLATHRLACWGLRQLLHELQGLHALLTDAEGWVLYWDFARLAERVLGFVERVLAVGC